MEIKTGLLKEKLGEIAQEAGEQLIEVLAHNSKDNFLKHLQYLKVRDDNDNWFNLTGRITEDGKSLVALEYDSVHNGSDEEEHELEIVSFDAYQIIELLDYLKAKI
jgi:hypothetical protein